MDRPYKYVPIIIPTMNRYDHFVACIESLQNNTFAKYTDIYISVDYPPNEKYIEGYRKIKEYLSNGISGFHEVFTFYQDHNLGASENSLFLRNIVSKRTDSCIYTEDDNVFSPNFIQYICECLSEFENNPNILAVCGHSIPINWDNSNNIVLFDTDFNAWGYASWESKRQVYCKYILDGRLDKALRNPLLGLKIFIKDKWTFCAMSTAFAGNFPILRTKNCFRPIDVAISLYMIVEKKYYVMPVVTKVQNMGYDGSGINCGKEDFALYNQSTLDHKECFTISKSDDFPIQKNAYHLLNCHNNISKRRLIKSVLIYLIYCLFGDKGIALIKKMYHLIQIWK